MKRAGGWLLGLLVVATLAGGACFALRHALNREVVAVVYLRSDLGDGPTGQAMARGAQFALEEATHRAGRFRIELLDHPPSEQDEASPVAAWFGTSQAVLSMGDVQPAPFCVSAFDTHPLEPTGCFRISPGCERQGQVAAAWVKESGAARIFLIQEAGSRRSETIAAAFASRIRELGLPVAGRIYSSPKPEILDLILAAQPDLVFYSGEEAPYSTSQRLFSGLRAKGYAGTLIMGEADPEVSFLATRPELVDGTYLVSPFAPAPPELAARMGTTPGPHVTAGYFAMKAVLDAIDRANSIDAADLRRSAARLPYFDQEGRAALRPCALYVARGGKFEYVETLK
jgi:ABC-type branched-subunit amino acid transport system substrate-binding protein